MIVKYVSFDSIDGVRSTKQHIMYEKDGKAKSLCGKITPINEDEEICSLNELEDEYKMPDCCKSCTKIQETKAVDTEYKCLSTSEKIKRIEWREIKNKVSQIYFESYFGVFDEEAYALDLYFKKLLIPEFECDYTFHHQGVYSATISINMEHELWKNTHTNNPKRNIQYWIDNIDELFKYPSV